MTRRTTSPDLTDLTGQRFGRLEVLSRAGGNKRGRALWLCRCLCLATVKVSTRNLQQGKVRSCGCIYWQSKDLAALFESRKWEIDRYDGLDPQIPQRKFLNLQDAFRDYPRYQVATYLEDAVEARVPDQELLTALQANLRNALTERERLVLQMIFQPQAIGGARVCRVFTNRGEVMEPGRWLAADEVLNITPLNRRALQAEGYLKIYPWSPAGEHEPRYRRARIFEGGITYGLIAKAAGLIDASHARKVEQRALRKLRKHLAALRRKS